MANPSVTNTFSNSTTSDATEVNTNFTDIINSLTDGTKSLSMDAGTFAGTLTANGDVTLGDASSDTLTVNASLGSNIVLSADGVHEIGSATAGLEAVYIGDGSGNTTKIYAGSGMSGDLNFRLPDDDGSLNDLLGTDGSGTLSWKTAIGAQTRGTAGGTLADATESSAQAFLTETFDTNTALASGVFTCPVAGIYQVSASMITAAQAAAVGNTFVIRIYQNTTSMAEVRDTSQSVDSRSFSGTISTLINAAASDTIEVRVRNDLGATLTFGTALSQNYFSIHRVS